MPSEGLLASEKRSKNFGFPFVFLVFITLQKCIRKRFATDLGGPSTLRWSLIWLPKASHGPQLGGPEPPKDPNLDAQGAHRPPSWTPKALPEPQHGGPKRSKRSAWRAKTLFWWRKAVQHLNLEAPGAPRRSIWLPKRLFRGTKLRAIRATTENRMQ